MQQLIWIGALGAAGSLARYGVTLAAQRWAGPDLPWGTLAVNVVGSALLGAIYELAARQGWSEEVKLALGTGFLGGFTTFSAFSVETLRLLEAGRTAEALGNAAGNLVLGLAAAALGVWLARLAG